MQSWTPEMWQAAVIGLVVGVILGYVLLRLTKGSVKKQVQTEAELKEVKTQLSDKQAQLEKHFAESAELFKTLIGDYQNCTVTMPLHLKPCLAVNPPTKVYLPSNW